MRTISSSVVALALVLLPTAAAAQSGWHIEPLRSESHQVTLAITPDTVHCGEVDVWGQSWLEVDASAMARFAALTAPVVAKLFEGPCDDERALLLATAGDSDKLVGTAELELYEYVAWGVVSEGTPNERHYCERTVIQDIDYEFKNGPADYSSRIELRVGELPKDVCIQLYGDGDGGKADDGGASGDGSLASAAGCAVSAASRGGATGWLLLVGTAIVAAGRRRRR